MYVSSALAGRHGLCVLLENVDRGGNRHFGLIDTGNSASWSAKAFLKKHGVQTLDFLILTHMHKDHIGNAVWILQNYNVKKVYLKQFDAEWSDGAQAAYEKILRTAVLRPSVKQIVGVSYALSINRDASPSVSDGFISFLKQHAADKGKFRGLFNGTNTALSLGNATVRIFNWEIWSRDGITQWTPGKNRRCRADRYAIDNSDNQFSLGVRVTQGSSRLWVGGDMNNLRLKKKRHAPYDGDEERLGPSIGKVNAAVLNHHGMGGSNCTAFLEALSPNFVVYTTSQADILSSSKDSLARKVWNDLTARLHLSREHILWASSCWGQRMEDPSVTISAKAVVSSAKDGLDMVHHNPAWKGSLTVPLQIGYTYTSYDITGDGKADNIRILSSAAGSSHRGLKILVNHRTAWSTSAVYTDTQPITLVRLPGKQSFICVSILSPKKNSGGTSAVTVKSNTVDPSGNKAPAGKGKTGTQNASAGPAKAAAAAGKNTAGKNTAGSNAAGKNTAGSNAAGKNSSGKEKGQLLKILRWGKKTTGSAGGASRYELLPVYDLLQSLPAAGFRYYGTPEIRSADGTITVTCSASDALCGKSAVSLPLVLRGTGLKLSTSLLPCVPSGSSTGTVKLRTQTALFGSADAAKQSTTLPAGTSVRVTHVHSLRSGAVRYRIVTADGQARWINAPDGQQ